MKNDKFFLKNLKSNVISANDFINDDDVELSILFKKSALDLMFN